MKNKQEIERMTQQALNSLDNLQQLEANEFLHTKILQRINSKAKIIPLVQSRVLLRLAAVLVLLIGINGVSFYVLKQRGTTVNTKTSTDADAFANAYNLNNTSDSY